MLPLQVGHFAWPFAAADTSRMLRQPATGALWGHAAWAAANVCPLTPTLWRAMIGSAFPPFVSKLTDNGMRGTP